MILTRRRSTFLIIFFITIIAAVLRFNQLTHRQYWMIDEERDAFIIKRILVEKHLTLVGGALPGGFYLAPGYFYISAFFYNFTGLNPVGIGKVAAALSVLSIPLLFIVVKRMASVPTAVIASFLYTFSYLTVIYNRTWWPLTFSPIVSVISYFSLFQIVKTKNLKWIFPLTASIIVGIQSDPSNFSMLLTSLIILLLYKIPLKNSKILLATTLLFLSHLPLLIFDIRHNFLNSRALLKFFSGHTGAGINFNPQVIWQTFLLLPSNFVRFFWVFGGKDVAFQINPAPIYTDAKYAAIPGFLLAVAAAALLYFCFTSFKDFKKNTATFIIGLHIVISVFGIIAQNFFFGNWNYEWILQILFPAYAIVSAVILVKVLNRFKALTYPAILVLLVFALLSSKVILESPNSFNLGDKLDAVKFAASQLAGQDFSLDSLGQNFAWGGYRYLFFVAGHEPLKSYMDPIYADWLYPKTTSVHPNKIVVMVNHEASYDQKTDLNYQKYLAKTLSRKNFGAIEVLIVENYDRWVNW